MTVDDLTHEQKVALAALVETVAISDGEVSPGEESRINRLVDTLGEEAFRDLLTEAEARLSEPDALERFLTTIDDQDARNLIYGIVLDEAMSNPSPLTPAADLLRRLAQTWKIDIEVGEED